MVEIETTSGGDPTNAIRALVESQKKPLTRDVIDLWYQETTDWLSDAAETRSEVGQAHGQQGRAQNGLDRIRDNSLPPSWNADRGAWEFSFPHEGAVFQEFGARPHEIRAKKAEKLAFGWPDQPAKTKEQFAHTEGDLVFFEKVDHPGIPAIGFVRYGRDQAEHYLESQGYDTEVFD